MYKVFAVSSALIMLTASISAGAAAALQTFDLAGVNGAGVVGAPGVATSTNVETVKQLQQTTDDWGLTRMVQGQVGGLAQLAGAGGMDGLFIVEQAGQGVGAQAQTHLGGVADLGLQTQMANVGLQDQVTKLGGLGAALGMQTFVGVQVQIVATPYGVNINAQPVTVSTFQAAGQ